MLGRHAYHEPWALAGWDARFFGAPAPVADRAEAEAAYVAYMTRLVAKARPGRTPRGTCWACTMACPVQGAGARCGRIIG
jgi:tRNA-dihydrouridine synthase